MTQKSAGLTRSLLFSRLPQAAIVGAIISCLRAGSRTQKCNVLVAAVCISGRMPLKRELQGTGMADKLGYSFSLWRQRSSAGQPSMFRAIPVASWGAPPAHGVSCNMQRGRMGAGKRNTATRRNCPNNKQPSRPHGKRHTHYMFNRSKPWSQQRNAAEHWNDRARQRAYLCLF